MFQWTQQNIDWFRQAAEHCDYHRQLAGLVGSCLPPDARAADLGCGLGYLSMELAPRLSRLTCVDISPQALAFLEAESRKRGLHNLSLVCGDWTRWAPEEPVDAVVLSYVSGVVDQLPLLLRKSRDLVISVMALSNRGSAGYGLDDLLPPRPRPGGRLRETWEEVGPALARRGIPFRRMEFALPFGQWLADRAQVRAFFRHYYALELSEEQLERYLAGREYPGGGYYLDSLRRGCVVAIRREQVPPEFLEGA